MEVWGGGSLTFLFRICAVWMLSSVSSKQTKLSPSYTAEDVSHCVCVCVCWPWVVFICAYILLRGVCVCMIVTLCVWRGHLGRICYLCCLYGLSMYACVHNKTVFGHKVCVPVCVVWCEGVDLYYSRWGDINPMTPSHCGALPSL